MENTVPCQCQPCPLPLLSCNCPSFLTLLTQLCWLPVSGLLIEEVGTVDLPRTKQQKWNLQNCFVQFSLCSWFICFSARPSLFRCPSVCTSASDASQFISMWRPLSIQTVVISVTRSVCCWFKLLRSVQQKKGSFKRLTAQQPPICYITHDVVDDVSTAFNKLFFNKIVTYCMWWLSRRARSN